VSRNTIRKYLRADTVQPQFKVNDGPSNLDLFSEKLSSWMTPVEFASSAGVNPGR
jgi:hypothetical protein